jgi:putative ABC transport system permease protein
MTTTLERPTTFSSLPGGNGGRTGRRAIIRWAWRLYRREWRQQLLALSLLIVAVAATTVGLGLVGNVISGDKSTFGTANTRLDIDATVAGVNVQAEAAQARQLFGTVEVIEHASIPIPGSIASADLRAQAQHGPFSAPMLRVISGHYPSGAGQIAVTPGLATTFRLSLGSAWTVNGHTERVVGTVEDPTDLQDDFALVPPGQLGQPTSFSMLFNSTGSATLQGFRPVGVQGIMTTDATGASQRRIQSLLVLVLSTIGMVFVGLLAVAGFTVMAQRRMRALGMIGAIGATDRQVRLVMLSNGAAVGVAGGLVGTVVGLAAWFGFRPAFEHLVGHRIDAANVQWWAVAVDAALAVVTALLAAWWPARSMARLPIVSALSGRPAPPPPAHRFAAAGTALLGAGFGLLVWAHPHTTPILVILGIIASVAGMLLIAPLGIRVAAMFGRRAPIAIRLALRDLARYQARSGAALAAVSLAIGIAATIAVTAAAQAAQSRDQTGGNLPANQLAVWTQTGGAPGGPGVKLGGGVQAAPAGGGAQTLTPAQLAALEQTVAAIASDIHASSTATIEQAIEPNAAPGRPGGAAGPFVVNLVQSLPDGFRSVAQLYVATPQVLALYHVPASAITGDIVTSRTDLGGMKIALGPDPSDLRSPTIQVLHSLPTYGSAPNTLISPQYATSLGLQVSPMGWLLQSNHTLTSGEITAARNAAAAAGVAIETRNQPDKSLQQLRDYSTAIGVLVALGVLMMTVGLIRSETANDLRTLSAAGASGSTRRTLTSATAGTLALVGGLLGTAGCYLALLAWNVHDLDYLAHPPVLDLLALIIGLPVAAIAIGWLTAFRAPSGIAHRPME